MKTLYREERIRMFLKDYYFGYGKFVTIMRLIGGPILIVVGLYNYENGLDKFSFAYSGFCIPYGIYMIFKPYLWVLFRLDSFKTENINLKMDNEFIIISSDKNETKIKFETFKEIIDNPSYVSFVISKSQRLRIPKRLMELGELDIVYSKLKGG